MNKIEEDIIAVLSKDKKLPKSDQVLAATVNGLYSDIVLSSIYWKYYDRAFHLLQLFNPDLFEDGLIKNYDPVIYDAEIELCNRVNKSVEIIINSNPELMIDMDEICKRIREIERQNTVFQLELSI